VIDKRNKTEGPLKKDKRNLRGARETDRHAREAKRVDRGDI